MGYLFRGPHHGGFASESFQRQIATPAGQEKLHQIHPGHGTQLNDDPAKVAEEWAYTAKILDLMPPPTLSRPSRRWLRRNSSRRQARHRLTWLFDGTSPRLCSVRCRTPETQNRLDVDRRRVFFLVNDLRCAGRHVLQKALTAKCMEIS